jgi:hypothetical protein
MGAMASQEDDEVLLERIAAAAQSGKGRSPLYRWMWNHYERLAEVLDRPDWDAVAREFETAGIRATTGTALTGTTVRQTWWKVRRDKGAPPRKRSVDRGTTTSAPSPTPAPPTPRPKPSTWPPDDGEPERPKFAPARLRRTPPKEEEH